MDLRDLGPELLGQLTGGRLGGSATARRRGRTALGLGVGVAAAGLGVASFLQGRKPLPSWSGTVRLEGLADPVEIFRDRWGVPAIFAQSEEDLFFAQGAVQAADRLFQMDLFRRVGFGRLAETVGPAGLASDRLVRALEFGPIAEREVELASPTTQHVLACHAAGVNAWIDRIQGRLPVEFGILGHEPEPWQPAHSLVFAKLMALGLCGNWEAELVRLEIAERFGVETLELLDGDGKLPGFPSQIDPQVLGSLSRALRDATEALGSGGTGSNNWVIAPERSESGGAILANDPHLDLAMPALWHECVLRCPTYEVRGFAIPGTPGVVIGHNGRISWGMTNSCADVQDLYVETIDDARGTYLDTDGIGNLVRNDETIRVRGAEDVSFTWRATRRGPVITDALGFDVSQPMSLRWDSRGPGRLIDAALRMNRARGWEEFREACRDWSAPGMNMVYADSDGNIGFQFTGDVPVRRGSDGRAPLAGDDPAGEWLGTIPFEELPCALNPDAGRIVTANDKVVPDDYPHFISREWMNGYRGLRIGERIDREDSHTVLGQTDIQSDTYSLPGRDLVEALRTLGAQPKTSAGRKLFDSLMGWDFRLDAGSRGGEAYRLVLWSLQEQVFGYLDDLLASWLGKSRTRATGFWSLLASTTPRIIEAIRDGDTTLLDHAWALHTSGRGEVAAAAQGNGKPPASVYGNIGPRRAHGGWRPQRTWRETVERAVDRAGALHESGGDAAAHRIRFQHPLGSVQGLGRLFNRGPWRVPGDTDTVWQASRFASDANDASVVGPSMRMVVDMKDLDSSVAIVAGGQSGHPNSPHYADQLPLWRSGRVRSAPWSGAALTDTARYTQIFQPAGS